MDGRMEKVGTWSDGQKVQRNSEWGTGKKDKAWTDLDIKSEGLKQPGWWDKVFFKGDLLKEGLISSGMLVIKT